MKHFVSASCGGEVCGHEVAWRDRPQDTDGSYYCGQPATHKVGEEIPHDDPMRNRHNLTMYVCCVHFGEILGPLARATCDDYIVAQLSEGEKP